MNTDKSLVEGVIKKLSKDVQFKRNLKELYTEEKCRQFKSVRGFVEIHVDVMGVPKTAEILEKELRDGLDLLFR